MDATQFLKSSNLLTAKSAVVDMLDGKTFTISSAKGQEFEDRDKIVLSLEETERGLPLNIPNNKILIEAFGKETKDWKGRKFMLLVIKKEFKGNTVDGMVLKPVTAENGVQTPSSLSQENGRAVI